MRYENQFLMGQQNFPQWCRRIDAVCVGVIAAHMIMIFQVMIMSSAKVNRESLPLICQINCIYAL